jgi:hypothetical protein
MIYNKPCIDQDLFFRQLDSELKSMLKRLGKYHLKEMENIYYIRKQKCLDEKWK